MTTEQMDVNDEFDRPKLDLPADEIARREEEKRQLLAGRQRGMLPDEVPGPRASRVTRDGSYPDQREPDFKPGPIVSTPAPVAAEHYAPPLGSSPAASAKLAALASVIRNQTLSKMPMKQYRAMLLAILDGR